MIRAMSKSWDNLFGRGDAAVTVPPLDGALRPNRKLDTASQRMALPDVRCLATVGGRLIASAGRQVLTLADDGTWEPLVEFESEVAAMTALGAAGQWAVALVAGGVTVLDDNRIQRQVSPPGLTCITAMIADGDTLYVANGSAACTQDDWQADLLRRNASGSVWRVDPATGQANAIARDLGWPAGLALSKSDLVIAEAWRHRLLRHPLNGAAAEVLVADLPGYPGHISTDETGHWLAIFAPRSQLVEFVQRETVYRDRMIADVPRDYWIAPKFRSGRNFYEPLQGGGVKQLGALKPWAPTFSAGLCLRLGTDFQPELSLHSRADGVTHGVTAAVAHQGRVFAAARGDGVVVSLGADEMGDTQ